jgi:hypothetical protein
MTGFKDIMIAIKPSRGGGCAISAVFGPDTTPFANLTPVNAGNAIKGKAAAEVGSSLITTFLDSSENLAVDVWNIFNIQAQLSDQKNMQIKVTNNSGGESNIEFAFMRLV